MTSSVPFVTSSVRPPTGTSTGVDQLILGPSGSVYPHDLLVETVELFGTAVIPEFDTDPEFSTNRHRAGA